MHVLWVCFFLVLYFEETHQTVRHYCGQACYLCESSASNDSHKSEDVMNTFVADVYWSMLGEQIF